MEGEAVQQELEPQRRCCLKLRGEGGDAGREREREIDSPAAYLPVTHFAPQAEANLKLAGKGSLTNGICRDPSPAVQSRAEEWTGMDSRANKQIPGTPPHQHRGRL